MTRKYSWKKTLSSLIDEAPNLEWGKQLIRDSLTWRDLLSSSLRRSVSRLILRKNKSNMLKREVWVLLDDRLVAVVRRFDLGVWISVRSSVRRLNVSQRGSSWFFRIHSLMSTSWRTPPPGASLSAGSFRARIWFFRHFFKSLVPCRFRWTFQFVASSFAA